MTGYSEPALWQGKEENHTKERGGERETKRREEKGKEKSQMEKYERK